ncbi:hypothetical protein CBER1_11690 [Cercospora berteroae]|uniref:BTB domain-containing protein n=1 Tax=Cercospora berteroae TaxID=357750 RepID=A0A2S6CIK8_9PEZI|nr:hypothetical protein CBER1_11690 [Cercospora berteroae]
MACKPFSTEEVVFDPQGDLILIVNGYTGLQRFLVASHAFALACKPWADMIRYQGILGREAGNQPSQIKFEDDDAAALEILLNIAHLRFRQIPDKLEFQQLLALSILTDKYQATPLISPWMQQWASNLHNLVQGPGHEEFSWIAWDFGMEEEFEQLSARITLNATIDHEGNCVVGETTASAQHLPPGLVDSVFDVRAVTLDRLLAIPYERADRISSSSARDTFCKKRNGKECDALSFGSLVLQLSQLGLWPSRLTNVDISLSIIELASALKRIKIHSYPHDSVDRYQNYYNEYVDLDDQCSSFGRMPQQIDAVLREIPSSVTSAHREHIKHQLGHL